MQKQENPEFFFFCVAMELEFFPFFSKIPFFSFEMLRQSWVSSKRCFKQTNFPHFLHSYSFIGVNFALHWEFAHFLVDFGEIFWFSLQIFPFCNEEQLWVSGFYAVSRIFGGRICIQKARNLFGCIKEQDNETPYYYYYYIFI